MKPLAVMLFLGLIAHLGHAQCADTFELESVQAASSAAQDGKITLNVTTTRSYTCELISYVDAARTTVRQTEGSGSGTIVFQNLRNDVFYRVVFRFPNAERLLCRERVLDQIRINGTSR